jgi:Planctomycete cytochrome C
MTLGQWTWVRLLTVTLLFSAACGGGASSPTQPSPTPAPAPAMQATLSSIQAMVFSARCTSCHSGAAPEGNLRLSAADAYASLVSVPSSQRTLLRVAPNDSANSYLIHKLEGRADIVGHRMPPAPHLASEDVQTIRRWIDQGALNN